MKLRPSQITRDSRLQCREGLDEAVVADYAAALAEGATLPPVKVVRIATAGAIEYFLVDGWHRLEAAAQAKQRTVEADVVDGDWRTAQLEAVRANANHGLRRSQADKRRAVRVLLMDAEWCRKSTRELGELAGVSHAFVGQVRRHYGVEAGQVLTEEHQARCDGELPPRWAALRKKLHGWQMGDFDRIRCAASPAELAKTWRDGFHSYDSELFAAWQQRAEELATEAWPWPADVTAAQTKARIAALDTVADLERALRSVDCYGREDLYELLARILRLPEAPRVDDSLVELLANRPRLWAQAKARQEELRILAEKMAAAAKARGPSSVWEFRDAVVEAGDPAEQERLLRAAPPEFWNQGWAVPGKLHPDVREGFYREKVGTEGACPFPGCGGWVVSGRSCWKCSRRLEDWQRGVLANTRPITDALAIPGVAIELGGVILDQRDLKANLAICEAWRRDKAAVEKWFAKAPAGLREVLEAWVQAPPPVIVVSASGPAQEAPADPAEEGGDALDDDGLDEDAEGAA
jgi:hypothetical protein